jgi:hypothetical protein
MRYLTMPCFIMIIVPKMICRIQASDEDTMNYDEAMSPPGHKHVVEVVLKEVNNHITSNQWVIISRYQVSKGLHVLDCIWPMKMKRDINTRKVYKWNTRLDVHDGQQEFAVN